MDYSDVKMKPNKNQHADERTPLKALRERLGLTQQELAYELRASLPSISRWERGHREMLLSLEQIERLLELIKRADWTFADFLESTKDKACI